MSNCGTGGSAEDIFEAAGEYVTFDDNSSRLKKATKRILPFVFRSDYDNNERLELKAGYAKSPKQLLKVMKQQDIMSTGILHRVLDNPNVDYKVLAEIANLFKDKRVFAMVLMTEKYYENTYNPYIPDLFANLDMSIIQNFVSHSSQTPELIQSFYKQLQEENVKSPQIIDYISTAEKTSPELVESIYQEINDVEKKARILLYGNVTEDFFEQEIKDVFSHDSFFHSGTFGVFDKWIDQENVDFKKVQSLIANQKDIYEVYIHSVEERIGHLGNFRNECLDKCEAYSDINTKTFLFILERLYNT